MSAYPHHLGFCDGAAKGNPGPGAWGAIIRRMDGTVVERGDRQVPTTNNKMELAAAIAVLEELEGLEGPLVLFSDSSYVLRGITEWIGGWKRRGWVTATGTPVANADQWRTLDALAKGRGNAKAIDWRYVPGHAGVPGNERADEIASELALEREVQLYVGPADGYGVELDRDLPLDDGSMRNPQKAKSRGKGSSGKKAFSYLSFVDGKLERHATWPECERRVKGRSGARYRKAASAADETAIVVSWGLSAKQLP